VRDFRGELATVPKTAVMRFQKRIFRSSLVISGHLWSSLVISGHLWSSFPARLARTQPICGNDPPQIQVGRPSMRAVVESRVGRPLRWPPCPKFGRITPCAPGFPGAAHRTWRIGFEIRFNYGLRVSILRTARWQRPTRVAAKLQKSFSVITLAAMPTCCAHADPRPNRASTSPATHDQMSGFPTPDYTRCLKFVQFSQINS